MRLWFILFYFLRSAYSTCKESYMMFCDCVEDIQDYKTGNWTEVVIGNMKSSQGYSSGAINGNSFAGFENVKLLFIVNRISRIDENCFVGVTGQTLEFLKFYGNRINNIKTASFAGFKTLNHLKLVNNNIQNIEQFAFEGSVIKELDLSNNKLESVGENAFQECRITSISMKNNKLTYIHAAAINEYLEVLHLDYNELESIQNSFGSNSPRLKELTISHNKIAHISDVSMLQQIKRLDFSFNKVNYINFAQFEDLKDLVYLNLNSNKLERFPLKYLKKVKTEKLRLLLSYNLLTNLEIEDIKPITLTIFGNPWNCACLTEMTKKLHENNFTTTQCDQNLFSGGDLPVCLQQGSCQSNPVEDRTDLDRFLKAVEEKQNNLACNLFGDVGAEYIVTVRQNNS